MRAPVLDHRRVPGPLRPRACPGDPVTAVMEWNAMSGPAPACAAIVPTRGRPGSMAGLLEAFGQTAVCTELIICLDDDDPALGAYTELMARPLFARHRVAWFHGPRQGLTGWTNTVAGWACDRYEALITLGDDHRPVTPAWDRKLLDASRAMGGGWAYG